MNEMLQSHELRRLLETAIEASGPGGCVTLCRRDALKIRDYILANEEPVYQLELFEHATAS